MYPMQKFKEIFFIFKECGQASFIREYKEGRNQVPDPPTPGTGSPLHQHNQLVLAWTHSETWLYTVQFTLGTIVNLKVFVHTKILMCIYMFYVCLYYMYFLFMIYCT